MTILWPNNSGFNIISINIRSISPLTKLSKFKSVISNFYKLPAVISVQETWFKRDIVQIYELPGYKSVHCCRSDGHGGTPLYIRDILNFGDVVCLSEVVIRYHRFKVGRC